MAVASWLFKADAVACCTTLSMCLSSYIGWQVENPVNCVENASVPEPKTLSLGWAVQNFWLRGNVYRWGHSFFCDQGMVAKACHGMNRQSPIMWAFSLGIVACHWESWDLVKQSIDLCCDVLDKGISAGRVCLGGEQRICILLKFWGVMMPKNLPSMPYTHVISGRAWNL